LTTPYDKGQNDIKKVKDNSRTLNIREVVLYQQHTDAKTLCIEIVINSNKFLAVVDSAAQVSVLNKSLLHQLGPNIKLKQDIILKSRRQNIIQDLIKVKQLIYQYDMTLKNQ